MNRTKNIFCWLNEITIKKTPSTEFTDNDWENFNSWLVHRFISMHVHYIEIADYAQSLMPNNKKEIYNFYREMIPKRKVWSPYIKPKTKQPNKELVGYISSYFEVGSREALSYIHIMNKDEITQTLQKMGLDNKEIKPLFK